MVRANHDASKQLERFLTALFLPCELIELRFIESWTSRGHKKSRVVRSAKWLHSKDFLSQQKDLASFAYRERANIYFGVCPRAQVGDSSDEAITTIRCVWCDMDHVTVEKAAQCWYDAGVPRPSLIIGSGSGIHGYWLLDREIHTFEERSRFVSMLPHFYQSFGGDHVHNLSRVLRPPGTLNLKDARIGRPPLSCTLLACDPTLRYPLVTFAPWIALAENEANRSRLELPANVLASGTTRTRFDQRPEVAELVNRLDRPAADRSRRDFAIVCDLLRLGLSRAQIWELVSDRSKFESNGRPYFNVTVSNAQRSVRHEEALPS